MVTSSNFMGMLKNPTFKADKKGELFVSGTIILRFKSGPREAQENAILALADQAVNVLFETIQEELDLDPIKDDDDGGSDPTEDETESEAAANAGLADAEQAAQDQANAAMNAARDAEAAAGQGGPDNNEPGSGHGELVGDDGEAI